MIKSLSECSGERKREREREKAQALKQIISFKVKEKEGILVINRLDTLNLKRFDFLLKMNENSVKDLVASKTFRKNYFFEKKVTIAEMLNAHLKVEIKV